MDAAGGLLSLKAMGRQLGRSRDATMPAVELYGERLRTFWRMISSSGRAITCALYRTADQFELRAGEGDSDRWLWRG